MNRVVLTGRLTRDPELRTTQSGVSVCTFTIAVDRRYKNGSGEREADFLPCVAWRETGDFVKKYFNKGRRICVEGSVQARSYETADGDKRWVTEIIVDHAEFVDSKPEGEQAAPAPEPPPEPPAQHARQEAMDMNPQDEDDELPF